MATYTLTLIDRPGNRYTVTVPRNSTFQDIADAVTPLLRAQYNSRFLKVTKLWQNYAPFEFDKSLDYYGFFNPEERIKVMFEAPDLAINQYYRNPNRRTRGATYRNRMNRRQVARRVVNELPSNIVQYEIAQYLPRPNPFPQPNSNKPENIVFLGNSSYQPPGGGKRKTRKSKKSRRVTRRRR